MCDICDRARKLTAEAGALVLEVGRKYVVRDPVLAGIVWVRIDAIRPDINSKYHQVSATALYVQEVYSTITYAPNGNYNSSAGNNHWDLVAEYVEPPVPVLQLGPEHVGRRVRLRNGHISLVIGCQSHSIQTGRGYCSVSGWSSDSTLLDIVEVLP